jgi:hypothetical protein
MPVTFRYIDSRGDVTRPDSVCLSYRESTGNDKSAGTEVVQTVDLIGGCSRTRTCGPLIKSQLLYQLSYTPIAPRAELGSRRRTM